MQLQCPNCAKPLEVPDSSAGAVVSCPACNGQMQVPTVLAATAPAAADAPAAAGAAEPTKRCPFCGETVMKVASKCKHCKRELPRGVDFESVRQRLAAKDAAVRAKPPSAEEAAGKLSFWSRFRMGTVVSGSLTLFLGIMFLIGMLAPGDSLMVFTVLGAIFGIICGLAFLAWLIDDLTVPALHRRLTPEKGTSAFFKAIACGRMQHAYACLLDGDKDRTERTRSAISEVKVASGRYPFDDPRGFRDYWAGLCRNSGGYSRRMVISRIVLVKSEGDHAQVRVAGRIESYPLLALLGVFGGLILGLILVVVTTTKRDFETTKLLRKVDDQWWMVNGELDSPEDGALEVAAQLSAGPGA
jgi:hypothetical protein